MRTREEMEEAYGRVGSLLSQEEFENDETLQAIYEALKWFDGYDWSSTIGAYLP